MFFWVIRKGSHMAVCPEDEVVEAHELGWALCKKEGTLSEAEDSAKHYGAGTSPITDWRSIG